MVFSGLLLALVPSVASAQYNSLFSIGLFLLILIPAIVFGIRGKQLKVYGCILSWLGSCLIMIPNLYQFAQFLGFVLFEVFLVKWYNKHKRVYRLIFVLSILPLVLTKVSELASGMLGGYSFIGFVVISYVYFRVWQLLFESHDDNLASPSFPDIVYFVLIYILLHYGLLLSKVLKFK